MRCVLALSLLVLLSSAGCHMCASPYDYCGPVIDDNCGHYGCGCGTNSMHGSMEADDDSGQMMESRGSSPTMAPQPSAPQQAMPQKQEMTPRPAPPMQPSGSPQAKSRSGSYGYSYKNQTVARSSSNPNVDTRQYDSDQDVDQTTRRPSPNYQR